ncbi:protein involved in gliding motility SprE [Lacinutrix venerupis]|uniref:type IX secretion system periplasmic lipoprotein PorW/SprE n=1 Tax=Lacinutrix venerupis TaxID=1486034 RepID=UPI000EAF1C64|nr:tetratricopeptide repeat protein [Lacinutrix venerupis]RLJ63263.1 protein involved in gliding motility SprE [Lacinutrix venerupis]
MKTVKYFILLTGISALLITGCSRKNDSFISRNYHAVTTEYNILYNGNIAFEKGRKSLNEAYRDNYWEILPIERMQILDEVILPGQSKNADFTLAEEKAVKAVQKHGMNIQGKEHNPQIDEAYLLLGKSRYFDQRFVPALEAFNYILYKYPASSNINQARIWREKTNMRLENDELAIKNLKTLIEQVEPKGQDLADATSTMAQAYINIKSLDSALTQISIAAEATKNRFEEGRYYFIKGQLYNALEDKDSANIAFDKVIDLNRKIPRKYLISAHVEKAKNFNYEKGNKQEFLEHLKKLEKDRENRPFLDHIYHQVAQYYINQKQDSLATVYYNKSIRTNSSDKILMSRNYEILGDMNFDVNNYKLAGAYYDSTMTKMVENSKPYRIIKRKRENLDDVIYYEGVAEVNDSILNLVKMGEFDRARFFEDYVAKLKLEREAEAERLAIQEQKAILSQNNSGQAQNNSFKPKGNSANASSFYFYNDQTVAYGKNEFLRIWGDRENTDNWRWSDGSKATQFATTSNAENLNPENNKLLDVDFYLAQIPSDEKEIDSISKERNFAYYQLGLIYKEKFKEYDLAKSRFTDLLNNNPEKRLILPAKYNLLKMYETLGRTAEVNILKNEIITNYPDSRYAQILSNPEAALAKDESSPKSIYENTYKQFEAQEFESVIKKCVEYINTFEGDEIVPKFELLKAFAVGRLHGFEAYKKAINEVAVNYANTEEGIQAQSILDTSIKGLENSEFEDDLTATKCKVVYQFPSASKTEINTFKKTLDETIELAKYNNLSTSIDVYSKDKTFVVVHGLRSIEAAKGFTDIFPSELKYKIDRPFFGISTNNYRTVQIHKNLQAYMANK